MTCLLLSSEVMQVLNGNADVVGFKSIVLERRTSRSLVDVARVDRQIAFIDWRARQDGRSATIYGLRDLTTA